MELRQLRYFVTVVEEANFTRAAERLHVAQPGVSAQVRQLERELGQPLLDRTGRTVVPTEVGRAVLPYARAALAAVEGAREVVDEHTGLLRGRVVIGLVSGAATDEFDAASVLADFHDDHPGVDIALTEDTSDRMLAAVQRGELDLAMVGFGPQDPPPGVEFAVVLDEVLVAAVAVDDPLGDTARWVDLRDRPLICLSEGTGLRAVLTATCARAGVTPRVAFEGAAPGLLIRLAARGLGVAVVPGLAADQAQAAGLRVVPITEPTAHARMALTWREHGPTSPAARVLLDRLRAAFGAPAG
ncbi:LysR family transcriptional regulator [Actinosynnema sp. NPDC020468]|uniref:LysR family transcriptional regulator n=1 Tax=Actinosynnema sp. NPDC020468 TaxID=3154488 RepID=UPI0033C13638